MASIQKRFAYLAFLLPAIIGLNGCKCSAVSLGCADYSMNTAYDTTRIFVGPGPEDIALDLSQGAPRLIVSCDDRRSKKPPSGSFYAINLPGRDTFQFVIDKNLEALHPGDERAADWHPHGIALARIEGRDYLYSVVHRGKKGGRGYRSDEVVRFRIGADTLHYDTVYRSPELKAPNDIFALSDGSFYVSNMLKKSNMWQLLRGVFGARTGNVAYYHPQSGWKVAIPRQAYSNGIFVDEVSRSLYMAHGACKEFNRYSITTSGQVDLSSKTTSPTEITMGDNLTKDDEGYLWTTSHPCLFKFLNHSKKQKKHSPSLVYRIAPGTLEAELVYQNNGEEISAASTALWYGGKLYLAQVFDGFVLEIKWADGIR